MKFYDLLASWFKTGPRSLVRDAPSEPLLAVFIALALATRLTFWFYTGRVWEDALITITAARNVWEDFGLTPPLLVGRDSVEPVQASNST